MSQKRPKNYIFASILAVLGLMSIGGTSVSAREQVSSTGRAEATVVEPIRAVALSDLSFGSIAVDRHSGGTVEVAPDGGPATYSRSARPNCGSQEACKPHRASFSVTGEGDRTYRVSLPGSVAARGVKTGAELVVNQLAVRSFNQPALASGGRLDQEGQDRFFVGGTLHVPSGTKSDVFRSSLPVVISYN
ncbi:DUF4402 domain-containing protein [Erythrobacter rubeus]|uniref:DUF4402 domain-containing protein n=1 Tax=Erythrobacter rubeus TaxID=2760803 RepID=A0ABR8KV85_9SPHN|nr:DUF4402 domain-containing protein [Erythrobacter rubeus]MBD2843118.1 DUF4402 domain-containing protein [Erythrobacter rubeus]